MWNVTHRRVTSLAPTMTKAVFLFPTTACAGGGAAAGAPREEGRARVTSGAITAIATRQPTPTWIAAAAHLVEKVLTREREGERGGERPFEK